jgi:hypothetical protein
VGAGPPQARAEPEAAAPEDVEKADEPCEEPDRNQLAALSILGSPDDKGHGPRAGQDAAEGEDDPRPHDPGCTDGERQGKREDGDEIPGHCSGIGAAPGEREPVLVRLAQDRAERVFPDGDRLVQLTLGDDERDEHSDAVRVDP